MTEQANRNQSPTPPQSGLALFEHVHATLKASEETKKRLSTQLQAYGAAFAKLKQDYDKLLAQHKTQTSELNEVKAAKASLTETVRHQSSMIQSYESQFQMFSADVVRTDAQLLDCDSLVSSMFNLGEVNSQKAPTFDLDLEQTINAYAAAASASDTAPVLMTYAPLSVPEEVSQVFQDGSEPLITDADFNLDMDAIARDIEVETEKAA
jgi:hypothetical protein